MTPLRREINRLLKKAIRAHRHNNTSDAMFYVFWAFRTLRGNDSHEAALLDARRWIVSRIVTPH